MNHHFILFMDGERLKIKDYLKINDLKFIKF